MAADQVLLRLSWKFGGEHAPFIVALDKGYYKDNGIDITIKEGAGSMTVLKLIGQGEETFGTSSTNTVVKGVAGGIPVIQIMLNEAVRNQGIILRPDSDIKEPKDLIGKVIAGDVGSTSDIWEAFLDLNKIPKDKVTFLNAGPARLEAFAAGKADGVLGFATNNIPMLRKMGVINTKVFLFAKWGVPDYGDGAVTHVDTVKKKPDMIRRFVQASIKGIIYTNNNIEEAANICVKHFPMSDKGILIDQLNYIKKLYGTPLGWQDPKTIDALRNLFGKYGDLPQALEMPSSKCFTNDFLPKQ
jgi:NitT/TauT family transport system substrate-binding protein